MRDVAFRIIYDEDFGYVVNTLRRLGVRERDVEDIAHEVFVAVHRHLEAYDPSRPRRAWLFGFAVRCAAAHRRRAQHVREQVTDVEPVDAGPRADELVATDQARRLVLLGLEALDDTRRAIFVMHEIDGYRMPEVAEALGIPLNTGYSRLRLARREFTAAVREAQRRDR